MNFNLPSLTPEKMVPFIGAPIGGGFNLVETSAIARAAKRIFI